MASAADMLQVQQDLVQMKGIVDQLAGQMQTAKIDMGNIAQASLQEMKNFEEETVKKVQKVEADINSTVINAQNEFEAQRQNQAGHKSQIEQQQKDMETLLERTKAETTKIHSDIKGGLADFFTHTFLETCLKFWMMIQWFSHLYHYADHTFSNEEYSAPQ